MSEKIKDMACDLRIAIATHGAVWSHRMDIAANTLGQDSEKVKVDSKSGTTKGTCTCSYYNVLTANLPAAYRLLCILCYLHLVYCTMFVKITTHNNK